MPKLYSFAAALLLLMFPFTVQSQNGDSLLTELSTKWKNAKTYTMQMAELMPDSLYKFRPVADEMTFEEQLLHIAGNMEWLAVSYLGVNIAKDTVEYTGKKAVMSRLSKAFDVSLPAHHALNAGQLNEKISFFAGPKTRMQMLTLMHDHQTHHAGQLIVYLRLNGIKPPGYVGW